jgi:hypothetical protein
MSEDLLFIREINVAQFWRKHLGELEYTARDPDDLFRWYEAMEMRGPEEIRAHLEERTCRYPQLTVTGIVSRGPHPPLDIVELWLATHDKVRTASPWFGLTALLLLSAVVVPQFSGCQTVLPWQQRAAWIPQAATLVAGQVVVPQALSTMPSHGPAPPINVASPTAATIAAQNGNSVPSSTPLGAEVGISNGVANAASSSVSTATLSTPTASQGPAAPTASTFSSQQGGSQH